MSKKRRREESDPERQKCKSKTVDKCCILHIDGIQHLDFTPFSEIKVPVHEKLAQLHTIRDKRLEEPIESKYRLEDVCKRIPETLEDKDLHAIGYHRGCYQYFTKNLDRLKGRQASNEPPSSRPCRSSRSATSLFPPECIFCDKLEVKVSGKTERCTKFAVFKTKAGSIKDPSWKQITLRALEMNIQSLSRKVQGEDLFAREANFHPSCRKSFNLKYLNHLREKNCANDKEGSHDAAAHERAFKVILDYIQEEVVKGNKIVDLSLVRLLYVEALKEHGLHNPNYRSEKLKSRFENHAINELICFDKLNSGDRGCIFYNLIYNTNTSISDAMRYAYKLGNKNQCEDMALFLRDKIKRAFEESNPLPWPPTPDDLEAELLDDILPPDLSRFLNSLIYGDCNLNPCEKKKRIVRSIGQVRNLLADIQHNYNLGKTI